MAAARRKSTGSRKGRAATGGGSPSSGRAQEHAGKASARKAPPVKSSGKPGARRAGKAAGTPSTSAGLPSPRRDQGRDEDRELGLLCAQVAIERQAREVRLLFVGERLGIAEYFVLASVHNRRQARAIRDSARERLRAAGYGPPLASSEDPDGRWSLYDWGVVVLHLFDDEGRRHFDLDTLWADAEEVPVPAAVPGATSAVPGAAPEAGSAS